MTHVHHPACGCFGGGGFGFGYGVSSIGFGGGGFGGGGFGAVGYGVFAQGPLGFAGGDGWGWGGGGNPLAAQGFDPFLAMAQQRPDMVAANLFPNPATNRDQARQRAPQPARATEMLTIGDRLFRVGNLTRAVQRYDQATKADPDKAAPLVRLAQVAMVRGKYSDAANRIREAQAAEPGWLANAADVQGLFPEPADFARQVAKLEAHLQTQPQDRDAWLVLGAEWYLSGRTTKAADVFLRLSDRAEDPTLRAFLNATKAADPAPNE